MTWHEYERNGVAPTVWFLLLAGFWLYGSLSASHDARRKRRGVSRVGVVAKALSVPLVVGLVCYSVLADRVDDERRLLAQRAAPTTDATSVGSTGSGLGFVGGSGSGTTDGLGATARCADGTYSYSAHRQGTCSHHGGVAQWWPGQQAQPQAITPGFVQEPTPSPSPTADPPKTALGTVTAYFQAINNKDWPTVWALGGRNFGKSYEEMVAGYERTARDDAFVYDDDGSMVRVAVVAGENDGVSQLYMGQYNVTAGVITQGSLTLDKTDSGSGYAALAGNWTGHGRNLYITPGGLGVVSFRTYAWCASNPSPCDAQDGDEVVSGGLMTFSLTGLRGQRATGHRLGGTSSAPSSLSLDLEAGGSVLRLSGFEDAPFCNERAPANACGA